MLKAQLKSKIAQLDARWEDIEDILTSDFFGVLDYLPRRSFLARLLSCVVSLNPNVETPIVKEVDWDGSQLMFWPHLHAHDETAEPDVVIITDKWVLVVEVKLESGFGDRQPWREFMVGRKIAEDRGLPADSVYYLIVARTQLDLAPFFGPAESGRLNELRARTSYLKWHEAVALVESWLSGGPDEQMLPPEQGRMLQDLYAALRKRRSIVFSGYAFANAKPVDAATTPYFCFPLFAGFLGKTPAASGPADMVFLSGLVVGFASSGLLDVDSPSSNIFLPTAFRGFAKSESEVPRMVGPVFWPSNFGGSLNSVPVCTEGRDPFQGVPSHDEIDRRT